MGDATIRTNRLPRMSDRPIAHVARSYGGLTEPFVRQRVAVQVPGVPTELWYERGLGELPEASRSTRIPLLLPGSWGDRVFHRVPQIGPPLAGPYRAAETTANPRLIHAHFMTTGYLVGMVTRSPLVVNAYGFDVSVLGRRTAWRRAYRQLASRASMVLVHGPHMRSVVINLGFPPDAVRIVRIAADLQGITFVGPRVPREGPTRLLACGRFVEKKGHRLAVEAFSLLRATLPAGSLLEIVGSGPLLPDVARWAQEMGVADAILLPGALPRAEFHRRLAQSDLFLAPSVTSSNGDSEGGAPTTILDAQAVGTVVVGSTHADIPFVVENGRTGYLVAEGDADALAAGIVHALRDRGSWEALASEARRRVLELHSDEAVGRELVRLYRELI